MKKERGLAMALLALLGTLAAAAQGTPDFSKIAVLGDSLSAGFWNGSLNERGQKHGYAALLAEQAAASLALPLVSYPGIPIALKLEGFDPATGLPIIGYDGTQEGSLENPASQPTNLAVPGQTSVDCLNSVPDDQMNSMTDLVLGFPWVYVEQNPPLSQVGLSKQLGPTFIVLWIGSNDVLGGALAGDPALTIPSSVFAQTYPAILQSLSETGAKFVLANLPDVTVVPALTKGATLKSLGIDLAVLGIKKNDYVTPDGLAHLQLILTGQSSGPLTPGEVLTRAEAKKIQKIVKEDNKTIQKVAEQFHCPIVDIYGNLNKIAKSGYTLPSGQLLTTAFLGGIFSLDGVHPTFSGQAIVANYFIDAVNKYYGTQLQSVDVPAPEKAPASSIGLSAGVLNLPLVPHGALEPLMGSVPSP
jgi:lysophospholipase L1-like esterase